MTSKPRTVADSTADISRRYAEDMTALDLGLITESDITKGVQQPQYQAIPPELDKLLGIEKTKQPWATFTMPPNLNMVTMFHIFLVPFMKTAHDQNNLKQKLSSLKITKQKERKEQKTLISLLTECIELEKAMEYIQGKRGQFGKG